MMRRFVIEREIPNAGRMESSDLRAAAAKSNEVLASLAPHVQWVQSYVADDRLFCVYLAEDAQDVRKHAELSGCPADRIVEVRSVIDPMTAFAAL
jgi:hypothetical protein